MTILSAKKCWTFMEQGLVNCKIMLASGVMSVSGESVLKRRGGRLISRNVDLWRSYQKFIRPTKTAVPLLGHLQKPFAKARWFNGVNFIALVCYNWNRTDFDLMKRSKKKHVLSCFHAKAARPPAQTVIVCNCLHIQKNPSAYNMAMNFPAARAAWGAQRPRPSPRPLRWTAGCNSAWSMVFYGFLGLPWFTLRVR